MLENNSGDCIATLTDGFTLSNNKSNIIQNIYKYKKKHIVEFNQSNKSTWWIANISKKTIMLLDTQSIEKNKDNSLSAIHFTNGKSLCFPSTSDINSDPRLSYNNIPLVIDFSFSIRSNIENLKIANDIKKFKTS